MNRNRSDVADGLHIPDLAEQLLLGKNMVGILRQEGKEIKLLGSKGLLLPIDPDTAGCLVDL